MTKGKGKQPAARAKTPQPSTPDLLKGERVSFHDDATKSKATDEELNSRYAKGDIRIVTESARYSLAGILAMLQETVEGVGGGKELRYKLDLVYQRGEWKHFGRRSLIGLSFGG